MRLLVLTSIDRGFASLCLPHLVGMEDADVAMVIRAGAASGGRWRRLRRKAAKTARIGLLGAVNGIRMRPWFTDDVAEALDLEPIDVVARRCGVRMETAPHIASARTVELVDAAGADLGLALGAGYIPSSVFTRPPKGMLNVHHEVLPTYRGAHSVLWQIHDGSRQTGYTVHRVERVIDGGAILDRQRVAIDLQPTLRATVTATVARLYRESAERLPWIIGRYDELMAASEPQGAGRRYTTPTFAEYRRMVAQHRAMLEGG